MHALVFASTICGAAIAGEVIAAGTGANETLRTLKQPCWALPVMGWYALGLLYYIVCWFVLYRTSNFALLTNMRKLALALMITIMAANVCWNFSFLRRRKLALSFWYMLPYGFLALLLLSTLARIDRQSALIFLAYVFYIPYAVGWTFQVWKLNT
jgi:tryptophan-rich sensory protein